ncbi:ATP-binding protein [Eubacterium maltosivorans]|uniref:ATP-binding protein n=1 Tax=Eubacterium maltosivorans TaxID=2041044 RepID=UPI003A926F14
MNERTKKVYDAFEQKQFRNKFELKRKQEALYAAIPKLAELDHAINLQGIRMTREVSRKNPDAISEFRQSVEALKKQKEALLLENGYPLDYLTLRYDCPICKDTGYVDGQVCSCLKQELIRAAFNNYDLNVHAQTENFDTFNPDYYADEAIETQNGSPREKMCRLKEKMQHYCLHFESQNDNYLFTGKPGVGKTFMSNCVANALIGRGYNVIYITAAHLVQDIQSKIFNDNIPINEIYSPLFTADLLIIDDFGAEFYSDFSKKQLFEVINTRLQEHKKIILSTNLTMPQILENYDERLTSRIRGNFLNIVFAGDDIRLIKKRMG